MVKIIRFILLFFILLVANADTLTDRFDDNFLASDNNAREVFYKQLTSKYSNSMSKDRQILYLNRMMFAAKILGYDYKKYDEKLKKFGANYEDYKKFINNKTNNDLLLKNKPVSSSVSNNNILLKRLYEEDGNIVLEFTSNMSDYKYFEITGKNHRLVMDFKSKKGFNGIPNLKSIDTVRFGNQSNGVLRVVLENKERFFPQILNDFNRVIVSLNQKNTTHTKKIDKNTKIDKNKRVLKTIVIDPGHGGHDPGAIGNGLKEKDIVFSISKRLGDELKKRGYKVLYTRNKDTFIELRDRTKFANAKKADIFVSIHANASPNIKRVNDFSGFETFFLSPARSERSKNAAALENKSTVDEMNYFSKQTFLNFLNREKIIFSNKLAIDVQKNTLVKLKKYKTKDGGVREAPFWVLVGALMPAILVETGYITHPVEGKNLSKKDYQEQIAKGIADGIDSYFLKNL